MVEGYRTSSSSDARLLFLVSSLSIGGSERKIVRLANALSRKGRSVVLAYLNAPETLRAEIDPAIPVVHLERKGKFSLAALRSLRQLVCERQIDVVVSINLYATLYAGLLALRRRALPRAVRFVASINATELRGRRVDRHMIVYRPVLHRMDLVIFGSEFQRKVWMERHLGARPPRTAVLYNGVDSEYFAPERVTPQRIPEWPHERVVVGSVGVLREVKSYEHLIEAISILERRGLDVGGVLVGDGECEAKLRALAEKLAVSDRVHFAGSQRDVRSYVAGFDIFAVTSSTETFSNAALEALAMGKPVVSSAVGGMPEMLSGGGGVVYEYGNATSLADALSPLVADEMKRKAVAASAREAVLRRFSFDAMVANFEQVLEAASQQAGAAAWVEHVAATSLRDLSR